MGQSPEFADKIYRQSVAMLADMRFDGLKLDGCGQFRNMTRWHELLRAKAPRVLGRVENCNNQPPPFADPAWRDGDCPFDWYRRSAQTHT